MAQFISTEPTDPPVEIEYEGETMPLELMQEKVGGYIELVFLNNGELLVIDEEGKLNGKPVNVNATLIAEKVLRPGDYIVGDALLIGRNEIE